MRIRRLHIRNLNSLRGEHLIDFTASPLADHNLYAIVGPTGAGKTTILDAITLALYGQTERNKSELDRKDGSASVLTYGEGECRAELEYETATGRFRSAWSRQRAHKKADGNLTASKHSLSQFDEKTEEWNILATKKRDVAERTKTVVGLDYERFVRSVMLTQGDFARFLKSDAGNKAEILEKITGTEIYRDLSIAAFTRAKQAREAHQLATEALATMPPLTAEIRARLDARLPELQAESEQLKKNLETVSEQLKNYLDRDAVAAKVTTAEQESDRLVIAWKAAAADRDQLATNDGLQGLRTDLAAELRLQQDLQERETAEAAAAQEEATLRTALTTATTAITAAKEKLRDFQEKLPGREEKFATVAAWEQEIVKLLRDAEGQEKGLANVQPIREEKASRKMVLDQEIAEIKAALAGLEPEKIRQRLVALEQTLPAATERLALLEGQLKSWGTKGRLEKEQAAATALEKELTVAMNEASQAENTLKTTTQTLADRRLQLNNLRVSQSLAEHKTDLQPGEECPVCGATEHPALADFEPVTDSALERSKQDVNQALTAEERARQNFQGAQTKVAGLRRRLDAHQALAKELSDQLANLPPTAGTNLRDIEQQRQSLRNELTLEQTEQTKLRGLQTQLPRLTALETELSTVTVRLAELTKEERTAKTTLTATRQKITEKRAAIKGEIGDRTAEQGREMTRRHKDELTTRLASAEKAEVDHQGRLAAFTSRQELLRRQRRKLEEELAATRDRLTKGLAARGLTTARARQCLLPEATATAIREKLQELSTFKATAQALHASLQNELTAAEKKLTKLPERAVLEKEKAERELAFSEAERQIGSHQEQVRQDDERIAAITSRRRELDNLRRELDRWTTLAKLIGSADGKKFRSYAQAITLERLIDAGNDHLRDINPRYRMQYAPPAAGTIESLEIIVVDTYHDDNRRTMATLSGGETFLISLALALGLSELASGRSLIQSLFIDEGFGTLDGKTLDQAMNTLEQLQASGKTIGLISHVPQLRERITCKIELEPVGDGFSRVKVIA